MLENQRASRLAVTRLEGGDDVEVILRATRVAPRGLLERALHLALHAQPRVAVEKVLVLGEHEQVVVERRIAGGVGRRVDEPVALDVGHRGLGEQPVAVQLTLRETPDRQLQGTELERRTGLEDRVGGVDVGVLLTDLVPAGTDGGRFEPVAVSVVRRVAREVAFVGAGHQRLDPRGVERETARRGASVGVLDEAATGSDQQPLRHTLPGRPHLGAGHQRLDARGVEREPARSGARVGVLDERPSRLDEQPGQYEPGGLRPHRPNRSRSSGRPLAQSHGSRSRLTRRGRRRKPGSRAHCDLLRFGRIGLSSGRRFSGSFGSVRRARSRHICRTGLMRQGELLEVEPDGLDAFVLEVAAYGLHHGGRAAQVHRHLATVQVFVAEVLGDVAGELGRGGLVGDAVVPR